MSGYNSFAVIGAGNVGAFIIEELLKAKAVGIVSTVLVVSRSDNTAAENPRWVSQGAKFAIIDYESPSTISTAFTNIDVVISTVGGPAIGKQQDLAAVAKSCSVKLFVPSEFGNPTNKPTAKGSRHGVKKDVQDKMRELDMPYCLFFNGPLPDYIFFHPLHGWDIKNGKVTIGGTGDAKISFTARVDIARFVIHVLTTFPASELEWKIFRIEGDRASFNEIASEYQAKSGKTLEIVHTPRSTLEQILEKNHDDFITHLKLSWDDGMGVVTGEGEVTNNNDWPEWNPKKVVDILLG